MRTSFLSRSGRRVVLKRLSLSHNGSFIRIDLLDSYLLFISTAEFDATFFFSFFEFRSGSRGIA